MMVGKVPKGTALRSTNNSGPVESEVSGKNVGKNFGKKTNTGHDKSRLQETLLFWRRWLRNPRQLGAILPSSTHLALAIARSALDHLPQGLKVLDLGAGTGRFTKALLDLGLPAQNLVCLELDKHMSQHLRNTFPGVEVIQGNACLVDQLVPPQWLGQFGVVVSGLPMINFSALTQNEIMKACGRLLCPEGAVVQFTYGFRSPLRLPDDQFTSRRLARVWRNVPPAVIWKYSQLDLWQTI
jgi:phosphatidylethanolamine/phosphatidyl-N-methylethanolamine N-methyltransferase